MNPTKQEYKIAVRNDEYLQEKGNYSINKYKAGIAKDGRLYVVKKGCCLRKLWNRISFGKLDYDVERVSDAYDNIKKVIHAYKNDSIQRKIDKVVAAGFELNISQLKGAEAELGGIEDLYKSEANALKAQLRIAKLQNQDIQNRLDQAATDLNQVQADLATAKADLAQAQADLITANARIDGFNNDQGYTAKAYRAVHGGNI